MAKTAASDPTDLPTAAPEGRVDDLYGLPLDEFTRARDGLAKDLRKEGQREAAQWVKGLRKPSGSAWVVNQLVRTQEGAVEDLEAAGQALRDAHETLLAGGGGSDEITAAAARQREAIAELAAKAQGLLDSDGNPPSQTTLERVAQTLEAVALDDALRAVFAKGRVTHDSRPVGLGLLGAGAPAPRAPRKQEVDRHPGTRHADSDAKKRGKLRNEIEAAQREERACLEGLESAEQMAERARQGLEDARRRLEVAEAELESARAAHAETSGNLEAAEAELEGARAAHVETRSRLEAMQEAMKKLAS